MTQHLEVRATNGPEGSIFLPKNKHVECFLALSGDPVELVTEILAEDRLDTAQILDRLCFSILQSRGVEKIGPDVTAEEEMRENEKRTHFYYAAMWGLELLASERSI